MASSTGPASDVDIAFIDNYDSFSYNLVQYFQELRAKVTVFRHDAVTVAELAAMNPRRIVISPGPGAPKDAGISCDVIRHFAGKVPVFGVCLGLQCMFEVYGGTVAHAGEIVHGKTSAMTHDGRGVFAGIPSPFRAIRYHSLAGRPDTLPACLEVTCTSANGIIQGVRHRELAVEGVQFHPESILTEHGKAMLANFLAVTDARAPTSAAPAAAGATGVSAGAGAAVSSAAASGVSVSGVTAGAEAPIHSVAGVAVPATA